MYIEEFLANHNCTKSKTLNHSCNYPKFVLSSHSAHSLKTLDTHEKPIGTIDEMQKH